MKKISDRLLLFEDEKKDVAKINISFNLKDVAKINIFFNLKDVAKNYYSLQKKYTNNPLNGSIVCNRTNGLYNFGNHLADISGNMYVEMVAILPLALTIAY